MNFKEILQHIEARQVETFCPLPEFLRDTNLLQRKRRGLYWIWTRLDFQAISDAWREPETDSVETNKISRQIPFKKLIKQREGLSHVCNVSKNDYTIVYNGIGGYKSESKGFGLRERILQEVNCNDHRTGTLNIRKWFNLEDWAVSYFDFDAPENHQIIEELREEGFYIKYASDLEMLWRLEYGHPILCRH